VSNANFFLVENCLGSYKELTAGRVNPPHNSRGTVNLHAQMSTSSEPIKNRKISRQDGVFGVFEVGVLHALSMAAIGGHCNPPCDSSATVPVFTDHDAILANLGVTVLFREIQAQVPCAVGVGGDILPRSGGADHGEASGVVHALSMARKRGDCNPPCAT